MIPVPLWVAVALVLVGVVLWLVEQPKRLRDQKARRDTMARLADPAVTTPPPRLPYGYSDPTTVANGDETTDD